MDKTSCQLHYIIKLTSFCFFNFFKQASFQFSRPFSRWATKITTEKQKNKIGCPKGKLARKLVSNTVISKQFSINFLWWWHGEFVKQSRASSVGDHFLYSQDPNIWFRGYVVRRNLVLVTLNSQRVKNVISHEGFAKYCISVGGWFLLAAGYFWLPLLSYHHRLNLPATIILLHKLWMVGKP